MRAVIGPGCVDRSPRENDCGKGCVSSAIDYEIDFHSKKFSVFGRGQLEFISCENHRIVAYVRKYEDEVILVVNNLSRFVQPVELDLRAFQGFVPIELFGETVFPRIGEAPYFLSLGPHTFYWFRLEKSGQA